MEIWKLAFAIILNAIVQSVGQINFLFAQRRCSKSGPNNQACVCIKASSRATAASSFLSIAPNFLSTPEQTAKNHDLLLTHRATQ